MANITCCTNIWLLDDTHCCLNIIKIFLFQHNYLFLNNVSYMPYRVPLDLHRCSNVSLFIHIPLHIIDVIKAANPMGQFVPTLYMLIFEKKFISVFSQTVDS